MRVAKHGAADRQTGVVDRLGALRSGRMAGDEPGNLGGGLGRGQVRHLVEHDEATVRDTAAMTRSDSTGVASSWTPATARTGVVISASRARTSKSARASQIQA